MDRRSFLKGAAAAVAAVPAIAAAPAPLATSTVTGAEFAAGSITASKVSIVKVYAGGAEFFDFDGRLRITIGMVDNLGQLLHTVGYGWDGEVAGVDYVG